MTTDLDRTPVFFPPLSHAQPSAISAAQLSSVFDATGAELDDAFDRVTPSLPLPLLTRKSSRPTWEPPPLRALLESTPPRPRLPMRSEVELECALSVEGEAYGLAWNAPVFATTSTLTIDWDTTYDVKPKRSYIGWIGVGAVYALGISTMVAFENDRQMTSKTTAVVHTSAIADLPSLSKMRPAAAEATGMATPIELKQPLHIIGFVSDPPPMHVPSVDEQLEKIVYPPRLGYPATHPGLPATSLGHSAPRTQYPRATQMSPQRPKPQRPELQSKELSPQPQEIDLGRLRVIIGSKAAQASACGGGQHAGRTRVAITFAPSGRATSAVLSGGPFNGTAVGSCIASVMRSAQIPAFKGSHTTVSKTVTLRKKRSD